MTIAPIECSVRVAAEPERAFAAFTGAMGRWWPKGMTIGASPHADIVIEPRASGRWFERAEDGSETNWGKVVVWEPPRRVNLAWQIDAGWTYDAALVTEVEISFVAQDDGSTVVRLEHRDLERFGDSAAKHAEQLGGGWPSLLQAFAVLAEDPDRTQGEEDQ
jgi:uncharacterized protein YndB with AHSA1/START domain